MIKPKKKKTIPEKKIKPKRKKIKLRPKGE